MTARCWKCGDECSLTRETVVVAGKAMDYCEAHTPTGFRGGRVLGRHRVAPLPDKLVKEAVRGSD